MRRRFGLDCWFALACSDPTAPVAIGATELVAVGDPVEPASALAEPTVAHGSTNHDRPHVDELVFGPNPAAYDRTGRPTPPRVPRGPDEDYTADPYEFHYEDVPGLEGVRAPTNHVTLVLQAGQGRDVAQRIAAAEGGEIVGQIPESQWYDLRLTTTTFDDVAAAVERIRSMAGVEIVGFVGEAHVARGREALATE